MTDSPRCHDPACTDGPRDEQHPDTPEPRWAAHAGLLCLRCTALLEQRLAELPARHQALRAVLTSPLRSRTGSGGKPTKAEAPPTEFPVAVHDHLELLATTVASWASLVAEARDLRGPDRTDVTTLAPWLLHQLPWLLEQAWVGDLADEMRDLARTADNLAQTSRRWNRLDAPCPACAAHELGRWDGADQVQCAACDSAWPEQDYPRLVRVLATDSGTSVTADEAARRAGVRPATFRQWVSRGHVRRLGTVDGVARYSTTDLDGMTVEEKTA